MGAEPGRPNELSPITRIETARVRLVQSAASRGFIEPGPPWQNPFVESFGSRIRDEVLSVEAFDSVLDAQTVLADWKTSSNHRRPHSSLGWRLPAAYVASLTTNESEKLGPTLITAGPTNWGRSGGGSGETAQCNHQQCCRGACDQNRARMTSWKAGAQMAGRWPRNEWRTLWPRPSALF